MSVKMPAAPIFRPTVDRATAAKRDGHYSASLRSALPSAPTPVTSHEESSPKKVWWGTGALKGLKE